MPQTGKTKPLYSLFRAGAYLFYHLYYKLRYTGILGLYTPFYNLILNVKTTLFTKVVYFLEKLVYSCLHSFPLS